MVDEPEYVADTLAWCNSRRAEKGKRALKRLPKGEKLKGSSCPCGKATGLHVARAYYYAPETPGNTFDLPESVRLFVKAFDDGQLPQYDAKRRSDG